MMKDNKNILLSLYTESVPMKKIQMARLISHFACFTHNIAQLVDDVQDEELKANMLEEIAYILYYAKTVSTPFYYECMKDDRV